MFDECLSLKDLNLINFNTNKVRDMRYMFRRCSDDLKRKIKSENKNLKIKPSINDD
jgi:surface protein